MIGHIMVMNRSEYYALFGIVLVGLLALMPGLSGTALLGQGDEVMHIATVRDSLDSQSYMVPIVNGATNYHKPPLLFWLGMASEMAFGRSMWADRMPAVIMALLSALAVFGTLRVLRVELRTAFALSLAYIFTIAVLKFGRLLMMEQALVASMSGVAFFFARYIRYRQLRDVLFAGLIAAVSYLYLGPLIQGYAGLLLAVWAGSLVWRFQLDPFRWRGRKSLAEVIRVGFVFHLPKVVPLAWLGCISSQGPGGSLLLQYFFQFENVGKFLEANQPEGRIFGGWLMYSAPWSLLFIVMVVLAIRARVRSRARWTAAILLWTGVCFTLLHLLPNRKDGYYILPALPLVWAGAAALVDFRALSLQRAVFANLVAALLVGVIFLLPAFLLGAGPGYYLLAVPAVLVAAVALFFWRRLSARERYGALFAAGIGTVATFQFALMPLLDRPYAPAAIRSQLTTDLCVVSKESWDGFIYKNTLPAHDIKHTAPSVAEACGEGRRGLIAYRVEGYEAPSGYERSLSWPVWREGLSADEILAGLRDPALLQTEIIYYRPAGEVAQSGGGEDGEAEQASL